MKFFVLLSTTLAAASAQYPVGYAGLGYAPAAYAGAYGAYGAVAPAAYHAAAPVAVAAAPAVAAVAPVTAVAPIARGDQQPVQGRGRGRQHRLRLPEHQQR